MESIELPPLAATSHLFRSYKVRNEIYFIVRNKKNDQLVMLRIRSRVVVAEKGKHRDL